MNPVATIQAIMLRRVSADSLTDDERAERRRNWEAVRARETEDEEILHATFRSLTPEQANTLARWVLRRYDAQPHGLDWPGWLGTIANYVDGGLDGLYAPMVARRFFWPGGVYCGADLAARDEIIRLIEDPMWPKNALNDMLLCLAWIGDDVVRGRFLAWREQPPPWRKTLYVSPEEYAVEADWELTPEGERRDLFYTTSYELVAHDESDETGRSSPVRAAVPEPLVGQRCGWCGRDLRVLFALDLGDPRLAFLGCSGMSLRIARCDFCSPYATVYTDVDFKGNATWSASTGPQPAASGSWAEYPLVGRQLVLGSRRRTPAEMVGAYWSAHDSSLGGHPDWIDDAQYPECPECRRRMRFVGQVETCDVIDNAEGITYAFLCAEHGKAATTYQQT